MAPANPERTIVVDGVRLTEAQVRAAVKALEAPPPPPVLRLKDLKPGEWYTQARIRCITCVYPRMVTSGVVRPNQWIGHTATVDRTGWVGWDMDDLAVVRVPAPSFTDTGSAS